MEINDQMKNSKNLIGETTNVWCSNGSDKVCFIGNYKREFACSLVDDGFVYLETTEDVVFY